MGGQAQASNARRAARSGAHIVSGKPSKSKHQPVNAFQSVPSHLRDALTGAPLDPRGALFIRVRDPYQDDERDVPESIDTAQPYVLPEPTTPASRKDYLGGLEWTPTAKRFFKSVVPAGIEHARLVWREWWRAPGVVDELVLRFGQDKLDAVLRWKRDGEDVHQIAADYRKTVHRINMWRSEIVGTVRREYLSRELLYAAADFARQLERMEHERAS